MFFGINVWNNIYSIKAPCYLIPFFSNICVHLEKGKRGTRFPVIMRELFSGILHYEHVTQAMEELNQIERELKLIPVSRYVYNFLEPNRPKPVGMKLPSYATSLYAYITNGDDKEIVPELRRALTDALYFKDNIWIGDSVVNNDKYKRPYAEDNLEHFVFLEQDGELILDRYFGTMKSVTVPEHKDGIPITVIGEKAFSYNIKVEEIILSQLVTTLCAESFYSCSKLKKITLGNNINQIGGKAFSDCYSLLQIELPKGLKIIEEKTFANCLALDEVIVPDGLETIAKEAFFDCPKLGTIALPASIAEISTLAFKKTKNHLRMTAPQGSIAAKYAKKYCLH